jgi:hypothetical protein
MNNFICILYTMDPIRLQKACAGKAASQGGLNMPDIVAIAKQQGHSGVGKRDELLAVICKSLGTTVAKVVAAAPVAVQAPAPIAIQAPAPVAVVAAPSNDTLKRACEGKAASAGGMNLPEIKALAKSMGHSGAGTRAELLLVVCAGLNVPAKIQAKAAEAVVAAAAGEAAAATRAPMSQVKLPAVVRGGVKVNTDAWLQRKPTTKGERADVMGQCGAPCFLEPSELKYPICGKGSCDLDCDGLRAAYGVTAILHNRKNISASARSTAAAARAKAEQLGKVHCGWE